MNYPTDDKYLLKKNQFQGMVIMPKEVKKKIILQDSQKPESEGNLLKKALLQLTGEYVKPSPLKRQWTVEDSFLWWKNGEVLSDELDESKL